MKNALPVKAQSLGGRHYRNSPEGRPYVDQNFDVYYPVPQPGIKTEQEY